MSRRSTRRNKVPIPSEKTILLVDKERIREEALLHDNGSGEILGEHPFSDTTFLAQGQVAPESYPPLRITESIPHPVQNPLYFDNYTDVPSLNKFQRSICGFLSRYLKVDGKADLRSHYVTAESKKMLPLGGTIETVYRLSLDQEPPPDFSKNMAIALNESDFAFKFPNDRTLGEEIEDRSLPDRSGFMEVLKTTLEVVTDLEVSYRIATVGYSRKVLTLIQDMFPRTTFDFYDRLEQMSDIGIVDALALRSPVTTEDMLLLSHIVDRPDTKMRALFYRKSPTIGESEDDGGNAVTAILFRGRPIFIPWDTQFEGSISFLYSLEFQKLVPNAIFSMLASEVMSRYWSFYRLFSIFGIYETDKYMSPEVRLDRCGNCALESRLWELYVDRFYGKSYREKRIPSLLSASEILGFPDKRSSHNVSYMYNSISTSETVNLKKKWDHPGDLETMVRILKSDSDVFYKPSWLSESGEVEIEASHDASQVSEKAGNERGVSHIDTPKGDPRDRSKGRKTRNKGANENRRISPSSSSRTTGSTARYTSNARGTRTTGSSRGARTTDNARGARNRGTETRSNARGAKNKSGASNTRGAKSNRGASNTRGAKSNRGATSSRAKRTGW